MVCNDVRAEKRLCRYFLHLSITQWTETNKFAALTSGALPRCWDRTIMFTRVSGLLLSWKQGISKQISFPTNTHPCEQMNKQVIAIFVGVAVHLPCPWLPAKRFQRHQIFLAPCMQPPVHSATEEWNYACPQALGKCRKHLEVCRHPAKTKLMQQQHKLHQSWVPILSEMTGLLDKWQFFNKRQK